MDNKMPAIINWRLPLTVLVFFSWVALMVVVSYRVQQQSNDRTEDALAFARTGLVEIASAQLNVQDTVAQLTESNETVVDLTKQAEQLRPDVTEIGQALADVQVDLDARIREVQSQVNRLEAVLGRTTTNLTMYADNLTEYGERLFQYTQDLYIFREQGSPWRVESRPYFISLEVGAHSYDTQVSVRDFPAAVVGGWNMSGCGGTGSDAPDSIYVTRTETTWELTVENYTDCDDLELQIVFIPPTLVGTFHDVIPLTR